VPTAQLLLLVEFVCAKNVFVPNCGISCSSSSAHEARADCCCSLISRLQHCKSFIVNNEAVNNYPFISQHTRLRC